MYYYILYISMLINLLIKNTRMNISDLSVKGRKIADQIRKNWVNNGVVYIFSVSIKLKLKAPNDRDRENGSSEAQDR